MKTRLSFCAAPPCRRVRRVMKGYALFEALIAVVVLSVGFVGAARMQTVGLKLNNSAHSRQKASLLAYQMTDRIRANSAADYVAASSATGGSAACLDASTGCSPTEMAAADVVQWQADIASQLPLASGVVCQDSTPNDPDATAADPKCDGVGNALVVKVFWTDTVATAGSVFATPVRPL